MSLVAIRRTDVAPAETAPAQVDPARPPTGALVAGAGEPVVLLHASLSSKSQWQPLMEHLAPQFRTIALDLCGYGDNPLPEQRGAHSIDDEVALIEERLDAIAGRESRIHLVGHSYGGLVALRFALRHRGRVASLSLFEPVAVRVLAEDDRSLALFKCVAADATALAAAGHLANVAETVVDFWSGLGSYASMPPRTREAIVRCCAKMPLDFEAAWGWRIDEAALRMLHTPTLLLAGRRSPQVTRQVVARLSALLLDCRVGAFDCGHMGPITDPGVVNTAIAAFVRRHIAA